MQSGHCVILVKRLEITAYAFRSRWKTVNEWLVKVSPIITSTKETTSCIMMLASTSTLCRATFVKRSFKIGADGGGLV